MELRLALWLINGCLVEIASPCPACGQMLVIRLDGLKYTEMARFRDQMTACPCGMCHYPAVDDNPVSYYIKVYQEQIWECLRADMGRGLRKGESKPAKRKKPLKAEAAEVRFWRYAS